jgi:hypothetical protein
MRERSGDLSAYPDDDAEDAVLRDFTESEECTYGFAYNRTIGDLLVDMFTDSPYGPIEQGDSEPENWESLEHAFMLSTVVQLKAVNFCTSHAFDPSGDDEVCAPHLTREEVARLLGGIAKRLQAGAELCSRLRRARWGHPSFGGGEGWEQRKSAVRKSDVVPAIRPNGGVPRAAK